MWILKGEQVLQSVISKYNYSPHRNSELRLNANKTRSATAVDPQHLKVKE